MASYNLKPKQFNAYGLASLYLRTAGLPDTARNRRILAAWFRIESKQIGRTDVLVYNNNPLNYTCTSCSDYHQFDGNGRKFVNYSGTTAGAQAWTAAINRPIYRPIKIALSHSDWGAMQAALSATPWVGAPPNPIYAGHFRSQYNSLTDNPGTIPNYADGSTFTGYTGQTKSVLGAFYKNGTPLYMHQRGTPITERDVKDMMAALEKAGFFTGHFPVADLMARGDVEKILMSHVGDKWNEETVAKISEEIGIQAVAAGDPLAGTPLDGPLDALGNINRLLDPEKFGPNLFHITGIILGFALVGYGLKILFSAAGVQGVSSGGGGGATIISNTETRYPMIIKEGASESPDIEAPAAPKPPVRRRKVTTEADWARATETPPGGGNTYGSSSSATAPLKKVEA